MIQDGNWGVLSIEERRRLTPEETDEYNRYRRWLSDHWLRGVDFRDISQTWIVFPRTWPESREMPDALRDDAMRNWRRHNEDDGVWVEDAAPAAGKETTT